MSTHYRPMPDIKFSELFDGALASFQVREEVTDRTTPNHRCLTDGNNWLWVYRGDDGSVAGITRYGLANAPGKILRAIADAFEVEIVSEYEPQYWGFDTQEEWDAWMEKLAAEDRDRFYKDVMHYIRGENHGLTPGTIGAIQADIAKALVADDAELGLPESKDRLLQAIDSVYDRDQAVTVTLTPTDIAIADMCATHEDDLPKA